MVSFVCFDMYIRQKKTLHGNFDEEQTQAKLR